MKKQLFVILFCLFAGWISAQTISIKGHVEDSKHHSLPGATIYLWIKDSPSTRVGNVTGNDGSFVVSKLYVGTYMMQVSFIGFNTITETVKITQNGQDIGIIILHDKSMALS